MALLTKSAITMIDDGNLQLQRHLQVVDIVELGANRKVTPRYRMDLFDGVSKQKETIPNKYNDCVFVGDITKGSIVLLKGFSYPTIYKSRYVLFYTYSILCRYEYKNMF